MPRGYENFLLFPACPLSFAGSQSAGGKETTAGVFESFRRKGGSGESRRAFETSHARSVHVAGLSVIPSRGLSAEKPTRADIHARVISSMSKREATLLYVENYSGPPVARKPFYALVSSFARDPSSLSFRRLFFFFFIAFRFRLSIEDLMARKIIYGGRNEIPQSPIYHVAYFLAACLLKTFFPLSLQFSLSLSLSLSVFLSLVSRFEGIKDDPEQRSIGNFRIILAINRSPSNEAYLLIAY